MRKRQISTSRIYLQPTRRILVAINIGGASGRDALSGFFNYVNDGKKWRLKLLDNTKGLRDAILRETSAPYDGIATDYPSEPETVRFLGECGIPVVFTHFETACCATCPSASFVRLDDECVGRAAADYFVKMGTFRSFVFVAGSLEREDWSTLREKGFRNALSARHIECSTFILPPDANTLETEGLVKSLKKLNGPVAVFTDWDNTAFRVLEICAEAEIDVPGRVSILGTDNDEVICRGTIPTLSSVLPDHIGLGFASARELERLMNGGRPRIVAITSPVREIITRDSTSIPRPAEHLIRTAKRFIEANDTKNISPSDVVEHLRISRSLADLRFRELTGKSIGQMIAAARISAVKRKLASSRATVTEVAKSCEFSSVQALVRYFRQSTGQTPLAWRKRHKAT